MSDRPSARTATRPPRATPPIATVMVVITIVGALACPSLTASPSSPAHGARPQFAPATPATAARQAGDDRQLLPPRNLPPPLDPSPLDLYQAVGLADGALPAGAAVFDGRYPGVANLAPELLLALRDAATAAAADGVTLAVASGWRSPHYQDRLRREAVSAYGSEAEAARWVATADSSPHVSGEAVDIGPADAAAWLSDHGAKFGLCQIYGNEPWHYEPRPDASEHGCPAPYADPTHDPRMQP